MSCLAIVNRSSMVSNNLVQLMVDAIEQETFARFAPSWSRLPTPVQFYADESQVPREAYGIIPLVDSGDVPDALAWHDEENGRISGAVDVGKILNEANGSTFTGPVSISCALSHECWEAMINPWVISWQNDWATEVCDPVQEYTFVVNGVSLSDYVLPAFFNPQAFDGPYDRLGVIKAPFTLAPGGYAITRTGQIFGETKPYKLGHRKARILSGLR